MAIPFKRTLLPMFRFYKKLISSIEIRRYVEANELRLLNIGSSGNHPKNWLNVDIIPRRNTVYLDAADMSVIPDGSFDAVLCEHMIEHVPPIVGRRIIAEIYRILKPGGVVRFVTPDLLRLARLIINPTGDELRYLHLFCVWAEKVNLPTPHKTAVDCINIAFREYGHQYLYTKAELTLKICEAGFSSVVETLPSAVSNLLFGGAQGHPRFVGDEMSNLEAFAIEAVK